MSVNCQLACFVVWQTIQNPKTFNLQSYKTDKHQITDSLVLVNHVIRISNFLTFSECSVSVTFWGILWFYGHEFLSWLYMLISTLCILITTTFFYLCWCPPKEWCSHFYTLQKMINSNAFHLIYFDWWNSKRAYIFSHLCLKITPLCIKLNYFEFEKHLSYLELCMISVIIEPLSIFIL